MFERNYYYLVSGLPDIILDQKKITISPDEFRDELQHHLHPDDYRLAGLLFLPADNRNLMELLRKSGKPFDDSGNYSREELEQEIKEPYLTPAYMQRFITAYKSGTPLFDGLSWEDQLTWLYHDYARDCNNEFLAGWFEFDLNLRNIVAAINMRKHKLRGENYFIGDNTIVRAVKKSSLRDFGLGNDFDPIEKIINIQEIDNLLERERAMDNLRWNYLNEENTFNYFTVEVILAYIIKLKIVQRWLEMDVETGKQMFRKLIEDLETSYEFPREFMIRDARKDSQ
jgi:hypothetical protein